MSKFNSQREIIVPIVVGSTLQLSFTGHGCSVISINGIELNPSSSSSSAAAATTTIKSTMSYTSSSSNNDKDRNNNHDINKDKKRNRYRPDVINHPIARNTGEISIQALTTLSIDIMSSSSSSSHDDDDDDTVDVSYEQYAYIRAHSHQSSNDDNVQNNNNNSGGSRGNYDDNDTNECIISLTALKAGILTLNVNAIISEFYHHNDHGISHNSVEYDNSSVIFRRKSCQLKVILVPEYLTESLQLIDLIGHLEECHNLQDPMILLHSQLFFNKSSSSSSSSLKNTIITTNTSIHVHDHGNDDDHHHRQNRSKDANDRHNSDYFINTSELQKVWQTIKRELTSTSNSYSGNK